MNVAEILGKHVTLELECIDRVFCNLYIPPLQYEGGVAHFFHERGFPFPSAALMAPISKAFVGALERFAAAQDVPLFTFAHGARKDDIAHEHLARFGDEEGVLFVGKAQEKTAVFRTERRHNPTRASGLPVGSARTQALLGALLVFRLLPAGFSAADLRAHLAPLLGLAPEALSPGRISYELRRLRLHGLIERIPRSYRYRVTDAGLSQALFLSRVHSRLLRRALDAFEAQIDRELEETALAA